MPPESQARDVPEADPQVAIVIPHYDDVARLHVCLTALAPQVSRKEQVIVVDNDSPRGLSEIEVTFPWVTVLTQPERGAAAARNMGVAQSRAPWLVFLDADCKPGPTWVARARSLAAASPEIVTGGRIDIFDETPPPRSGAEAFETVFAFDQETYITQKGFSVTANLVVARTTFDRVGPFIVGVSEDLDWCHRATAEGFTLAYDADLAVAHPTRRDWPALRRKWRRLTAEEFGLCQARIGWIGKAVAMPLSIVAHAPRVITHPDLSALEKLRGLGTLGRLRLSRMVWMLGQVFRAAQ